jgi:hypothetical protein
MIVVRQFVEHLAADLREALVLVTFLSYRRGHFFHQARQQVHDSSHLQVLCLFRS